jgi:phosphatidylglycerophosphatase C
MNLALFDFDGTITRGDTWTPFLRCSATRTRIALAAVLLSPVIVGYKAGWIPARRGRPVVARLAFAGRRADAIGNAGRTYAAEVLPRMIRQQALERIDWHKRRGDRVVVVSASLDVYLQPWCEAHGLELVCTELEVCAGTLTGRYRHGDCSAADKVIRLRERYDLARYPVIYAYGDTEEDREMLDIAHEKYFRWQRIDEEASASSPQPTSAAWRPRPGA